jgi:hypothetical protein
MVCPQDSALGVILGPAARTAIDFPLNKAQVATTDVLHSFSAT